MITYRKIDSSYLDKYDKIPMVVNVKSILKLEKVQNGLGGILLKETPTEEYTKNLGCYENIGKSAQEFDITNWAFFMAFDNNSPIGAATVVSRTPNIHLLEDRDDISVLWDIRVDDKYKRKGVGTKLFDMSVKWSKSKELKQMKIECQNNNVQGCKFYHRQGAVLGKIDEYAYYKDIEDKDEVQLIWYLDL